MVMRMKRGWREGREMVDRWGQAKGRERKRGERDRAREGGEREG